jgi:hypothetical protein
MGAIIMMPPAVITRVVAVAVIRVVGGIVGGVVAADRHTEVETNPNAGFGRFGDGERSA